MNYFFEKKRCLYELYLFNDDHVHLLKKTYQWLK